MKCTFIGLGNLGKELCGRVGVAGFPTFAYDLNPDASKNAAEQFKNVIQSDLIDAVKQSEVILSCLPNSFLVREVVNNLISEKGSLQNIKFWIDTTSGHPGESQKIAEVLKLENVEFYDCAVSGGPAGASKGILTAMLGGEGAFVDQVKNILSSFAKNIVHLGPCGAGHAVKAVNNSLLAANICTVSESMVVLKKYGLNIEDALKAISTSSGRSWVTQQRFPEHVLNRKFDYGFSLGLLFKDIDTCMAMFQDSDTPSPVLRTTREMVQLARKTFGDEVDHLEIAKMVENWSDEKIE